MQSRCFSTVLAFLLAGLLTHAAKAGNYLVTVTGSGSDHQLQVEANIAATTRLRMALYGGIDHIPDQWTSFVRQLSVTDESRINRFRFETAPRTRVR